MPEKARPNFQNDDKSPEKIVLFYIYVKKIEAVKDAVDLVLA
jgi:hypothetical protein